VKHGEPADPRYKKHDKQDRPNAHSSSFKRDIETPGLHLETFDA